MMSTNASVSNCMKLDSASLELFGIARVFKENTSAINSMDFDAAGDLLVTASDDESIHLYNATNGSLKKTIFCKRYGVSHIRFTHHPQTVVCASKNSSWDDTIRLLSMYDNRYLRYFKAHRDAVNSLEVSPLNDMFISASLDRTVRLWDLRSNLCQGCMRVPSKSTVAFDPQARVFSVTSSTKLKLFDPRSFDKGPFASFDVLPPYNPPPPPVSVNGLEITYSVFSPNGEFILLSTSQSLLLLVDSFNGSEVRSFTGHVNVKGSMLEPCFSPDGQFVFVGSEDGSVYAWETVSGKQVATWSSHGGSVGCVRWSPSKMLFATSCSTLALWIPEYDPIPENELSASPGVQASPSGRSTRAFGSRPRKRRVSADVCTSDVPATKSAATDGTEEAETERLHFSGFSASGQTVAEQGLPAHRPEEREPGDSAESFAETETLDTAEKQEHGHQVSDGSDEEDDELTNSGLVSKLARANAL